MFFHGDGAADAFGHLSVSHLEDQGPADRLGVVIALLGREGKPFERLNPAFQRVDSAAIHALTMGLEPETELGGRIALAGSAQEPLTGFSVVTDDAASVLVQQTEVVLRQRMAALGGACETGRSRLITLGAIWRSAVNDAEIVLRLRPFNLGGSEQLGRSLAWPREHSAEPAREWRVFHLVVLKASRAMPDGPRSTQRATAKIKTGSLQRLRPAAGWIVQSAQKNM